MLVSSWLPLVHNLVHQGALQGMKSLNAVQAGAVQRLAEPTYYDLVFPFIAFGLVIVLPTSVALWVMYKTVTDKTAEADET